jgi:S1-C subfamily serine protease
MLAGGLAAFLTGGLVTGLAVVGAESSDTVSGAGSAQVIVPTIPGDMNRHPNGTSTSVSLATAAQQKGIVTVVSVLKYQNAESAGTGMVLTSAGEILTNNHVVNGATSIVATIASTGKSYRADVVGTDPSDDVAVLQLRGASGLQTANIGDSSGVAVGDDIVGVGNAGGTGTLRASAGTVTALNKSITATDETGSNSEKLKGLIQVHAPIVSGDSGGPLYNSAGQIVGMDTAASANQVSDSTAYAIPIDSALTIADKIESGVETAKIHIGLPAFLGVSVNKASGQGALVEGLLSGGPAASAGITSGSVVTKVGNQVVTTPDALRAALRAYNPGDKATVTWTTAGGSSRTATVTLGTGPAD